MHFGHEVADVEPTVANLLRLDPNVASEWEARYILLIWLSMAMLVPFSLSTIDGLASDDPGSIASRLYRVCLSYLSVAGREREGAAALLARLLSRRDTLPTFLPLFLDHVTQALAKPGGAASGALTALCVLFKFGQRDAIAPYLPRMLSIDAVARKAASVGTGGSILAKLYTKFVQRLGLALLPPRSASWKYKRGTYHIPCVHNAKLVSFL